MPAVDKITAEKDKCSASGKIEVYGCKMFKFDYS